jgi:hypothetical protein
MRPDYGCDIHRLVFWPNDDTTAGLAIHYVRQAIARLEPRIDVVRLRAGRSLEDPGRLEIDLHYHVRGTGRADFVSFNLSLAGEPA